MRFHILAVLTVLLDQLTKMVALETLAGGRSFPVIPGFFHFTLVHNTGIAFGFLQKHPEILFVMISLSILVLMAISLRSENIPAAGRVALALILGGAVGNWLDRLRFHAVIDFLDFRVWPVFNVADSAITIGVAIYILYLFKHPHAGAPDPEKEEGRAT